MQKKYYIFMLGRFISSFGNWFLELSLPFVIYELTGSAMAVSVSFLLETLPVILMTPITSYVVDNIAKRKMLQICELISGFVLFLCVLTKLKNIWILYLACLLLAVITNIYNITVNAYIPEIGRGMDLTLANAIDSFIGNAAMVIGPIIAGWCINLYGSGTSMLIDGISFIVAAIIFGCLPKVQEERCERKRESRVYTSFDSYFFILKNNDFLRKVLTICISFSVCGAVFSALDAVYVAEVFNSSTTVYGYINSAWGVGMIATSLLYVLYEKKSKIKVFTFGIICMGITTIGYGCSVSVLSCILFNFIGGLANTLYVIYYRSLLQMRTEEKDRGKVFTLQSTLSKVISVIVVGMAGAAADVYSVRHIIVLSGMMTIMLGLVCHKALHREVID